MRRSVAAWLGFLVALLLAAAPAMAQDTASIRRLMAATSLDTLFTATAGSVAAMQDFEAQGDPAYARHWARAAQAAYAHATMTERVAELLAGTLKKREIEAVIAFYTSGLGEALVAGERAMHAMSLAEYDRVLDTVASINAERPPTPQRQALLDRLYALSQGPLAEEVALETMRRILLGSAMTGVVPGDIEGAAEVEAWVAAYMPYYAKEIASTALLEHDYIYMTFTDAELQTLIDFATTPEALAFTAAAAPAIFQAYLEATDRFVALLAEMARGNDGA